MTREMIGAIHVERTVNDAPTIALALLVKGENVERIVIVVAGAHPDTVRRGACIDVDRLQIVAVSEEGLQHVQPLWAGGRWGDRQLPGADNVWRGWMVATRCIGGCGQHGQQTDDHEDGENSFVVHTFVS